MLISDKIAETELVLHPYNIRLVFEAPRREHVERFLQVRRGCPKKHHGVGGGETYNWQSADLFKRHRGIVVARRALDAGFFVVDFEMPWRVGIKYRIASAVWE